VSKRQTVEVVSSRLWITRNKSNVLQGKLHCVFAITELVCAPAQTPPPQSANDQNSLSGGNRGAVMLRTIGMLALAAVIAAVVSAFLGFAPRVEAHGNFPVSNVAAKGDRWDVRIVGAACSQRAWPYFEATCLRSTIDPNRKPRVVRLVGAERHTMTDVSAAQVRAH
jgi:hypothetical protein